MLLSSGYAAHFKQAFLPSHLNLHWQELCGAKGKNILFPVDNRSRRMLLSMP
jgi:hypothetical protein